MLQDLEYFNNDISTGKITSKKTHRVYILFTEIIAVYSEIHTKLINTLCGGKWGIAEC
jgi:hypothetical protein